MPRSRVTPKWTSKKYGIGHVEQARDQRVCKTDNAGNLIPYPGPRRCDLRYRGKRKTLDLLFVPSNRAAAVRELEMWIESMLAGWDGRSSKVGNDTGRSRRVAGHGAKISFAIALQEFASAKLIDADANRLKRHRLALNAIFREEDGDWPITDDEIKTRIKAWLDNPRGLWKDKAGAYRVLSPASVACRCTCLREFVRYALAAKWITVDPFPLLNVPKERSKAQEDRRIYSHEEEHRIRQWYTALAVRQQEYISPDGQTAEEYLDLWALLAVTGMRISEALSIRLHTDDPQHESHITTISIGLRKTKAGIDRNIPYREWPELAVMLDARVARLRAAEGRFLFPAWTASQPIARSLARCLAALDIAKPKRPVHTWRATAEHRMIYEQHLPEKLALLIVGHTETIFRGHYKVEPSAQEVASAMRHAQRGESDALLDDIE